VRLDAGHPDAGQSPRGREEVAGLADVDAELVLPQAGRDVGVRPRVDVGFTRRATRGDGPERRAQASIFSISRSDSALRARMPASTPAPISASVLPTPEKTTRSAGMPLSSAARSSPAGDDVGAAAELGHEAQEGEGGICLGRVADEVGDGLEGRVEAAKALFDDGAAVDIERRAIGVGELGEGDAVTAELTAGVAREAARHRAAR
jgi:hypothetical protein